MTGTPNGPVPVPGPVPAPHPPPIRWKWTKEDEEEFSRSTDWDVDRKMPPLPHYGKRPTGCLSVHSLVSLFRAFVDAGKPKLPVQADTEETSG